MSKRAESLLKEASQLPDGDRVQLIEDLVTTLEGAKGQYTSDPTALQMLVHVREILRRLRARGNTGTPGSKKDQIEALFGSLRNDPLERPPQGSFEARDELG
jgi:hypothetical protein